MVTVDTRTGEVTPEKVWAAHDVGKAINPESVEGQIEGGVVQGLGFALTEESVTEEGKILNPDFATYIIPCAGDVPVIEPIIVEAPFRDGPHGAKGFGEQPLMGVAPAVLNAVRDAVGVRLYSLPALPEKVWEAIKEKDFGP